MKKTKSAKDLAFDKERAKYRKEIRELSSELIKQRIDIDRLKQDIDRKDMELQEKDEWIRRLLEYMDMSEEDMRKIIQKDKTMAEAAERLSDINKVVSRFFWRKAGDDMAEKIVYTADDEEPNCGRCDHLVDNDKLCIEYCGGANSWYGYQRTEYLEDEE